MQGMLQRTPVWKFSIYIYDSVALIIINTIRQVLEYQPPLHSWRVRPTGRINIFKRMHRPTQFVQLASAYKARPAFARKRARRGTHHDHRN